MDNSTIKWIDTDDLSFDFKNPRMVEFDLSGRRTDEDMIKLLWETMDVREVLMSIEASGFFPHEALIVAQEGDKDVVIEGNRRLAAVKILQNPDQFKELAPKVPTLDKNKHRNLDKLPVVFSTRQDAWQYLGFKHVNGPAKWTSYAKSQYIADVHREMGVPLEEIAKQIGDTHRTAQRLYRGLMIIEQAERMKVFDREDRWNSHFSVSHLYTGIDYPGMSEFVGIKSENEEAKEPVPTEKRRELEELFLWLYGSRKKEIQPLIRSQNPDLRNLDRVLGDKEALAALRSHGILDIAYELCDTPSQIFEKSLRDAKRALEKAQSKLSTGYGGSIELLAIAGMIADIAYDLHEAMLRKQNPKKRQRVSEAA